MARIRTVLVGTMLVLELAAKNQLFADTLSERITRMVEPCIQRHWLRGVALGVTVKGQDQLLFFGHATERSPRPPDAKTIFEIGSTSKVFTAMALADMVAKGRVKLEDPVVSCLPPGTVVPAHGSRMITLLDLATHTSGLPRLPDNLPPDASDPYATYTDRHLYAFLKTFSLPQPPGVAFEYSNLGSGLLGHALALKDRASYEELMARRVGRPLGLEDTVLKLSASQLTRFAAGSDADLEAVGPWHFNVLAGAGGLHSNVAEMLKFVRAALGHDAHGLTPAFTLAEKSYRPMPGGSIGLGWHIIDAEETRWHNGATGGFHTYMAYNRRFDAGVVVLCNTESELVDFLGYSLLRLATGQSVAFPEPTAEVMLTPAQLAAYPATYRVNENLDLVVSADGGRLKVQPTGKDPFRLYAVAPDRFFCKSDLQAVVFRRNPAGAVISLTVHKGGQETHAQRLP
jgi:D-alanyl-D-alanine-carboxypeptidase/D-alanyl-D-alanine-endopeptidase